MMCNALGIIIIKNFLTVHSNGVDINIYFLFSVSLNVNIVDKFIFSCLIEIILVFNLP